MKNFLKNAKKLFKAIDDSVIANNNLVNINDALAVLFAYDEILTGLNDDEADKLDAFLSENFKGLIVCALISANNVNIKHLNERQKITLIFAFNRLNQFFKVVN